MAVFMAVGVGRAVGGAASEYAGVRQANLYRKIFF
jgi:hypothetical protein